MWRTKANIGDEVGLIGRQCDISLDGKRFLVVTPPREVADPPELVVIQHWDQELEALLAKK